MVDSLKPLGDAEEAAVMAKAAEQKLWIKIPSREDPRIRKIKLVLSFFPGENPVILYFEDCKKRVGTRCKIHPALVEDLKERMGEKNVVVQ